MIFCESIGVICEDSWPPSRTILSALTWLLMVLAVAALMSAATARFCVGLLVSSDILIHTFDAYLSH